MPIVTNNQTVRVGYTPSMRRTVFDELGIGDALMESLDMEVWNEQRDRLTNEVDAATVTVEEGSFRIPDYPRVRVGTREIRQAELPLNSANEILSIASGGRVRLVEHESRPGFFAFRSSSLIEDYAFEAYSGSSVIAGHNDIGDSYTIPVTALRLTMQEYSNFRASTSRRAAIRDAIRRSLRESINPPVEGKKKVNWTTEQARKFSAYFENIKKGLVVTPNPFDDIDILPTGTLASRFWGIEIEAVDIDGVDTPKYWVLKGDGSLRGLQYSSFPSNSGADPSAVIPEGGVVELTDHTDACAGRTIEEGCTCNECFFECDCGYDEQLRNAVGSNSRTGEWNSPVLRSFHSRGLKHITDKIEYRRTNDSAGIHVHVNAADLTPQQVVQVGLIYSALEPLFEAEYKRGATRSYCKSLDTAEFVSRFKTAAALKGTVDSDAVRRMARGADRYFTVNTESLGHHGTIEFRAMGARYNYDLLVRWAHFLREIVNMAKANIPTKAWRNVKTFRDLIVVMSKYGKETPTPSWASDTYDDSAIVARLGEEDRRAPSREAREGISTVFDQYVGNMAY